MKGVVTLIRIMQDYRITDYSNESVEAFEDTIYIDSVPVIEYKSGTDGFLYSIR